MDYSEVLQDAFRGKQEAERRMWAARDHAALLKQQATDAAVLALTAERHAQEAREYLSLVWQDYRADVGTRRASVSLIKPA